MNAVQPAAHNQPNYHNRMLSYLRSLCSQCEIKSRAEGMRKARRDRRVAHRGIVAILVIRLVGRARVRRAGDGLAVSRRETSRDVDAASDERKVPVGALAAPLAVVAVAVLGVDGLGGDACIVADEAAVASACCVDGER